MKILFLDDEPERHITFHQNNSVGNVLVQITLPTRAIQELDSSFQFDEVWLDHDLGFVEVNEPGTRPRFLELTAKPVVDWIIKNKKPEDLPKIVVHSWNLSGADWMTKRLQDNGFNVIKAPFNMNRRK